MMPEDYRPDPDALLESVKKEEERRLKGRLKIFLGMAAGVGKTCAMLSEAQELKSQGIEVQTGIVETHGRLDTAALAEGIEEIPRRNESYRGVIISEMDLDEILLRRPQLVLVDELAHTNAPGSRHQRRFQDVEELLDAGIDVYSTLNIQHIESLADSVEQLSGVHVHERVPDAILDLSAEIELVDITPEELQKRLHEGKVYHGEKAQRAVDNFFQRSNLTALREMALSTAARFVEHEMDRDLESGIFERPFRSRERILVSIGPGSHSARLLRIARRMAYDLRGDFLAVFIDTGKRLSESAKKTLRENIALARELGAHLIEAAGTDAASALVRIAREKKITQIIIGRGKPRGFFQTILKGKSLPEKLFENLADTDLHLVPDPDIRPSAFLSPLRATSSAKQYAIAALAIGLTTLLNLEVANLTTYWAPSIVYLFVVTLLGAFVGRGPTFLAALLSGLLWNILFIPPVLTFYISRAEDILILTAFFVVASVTGFLTSKIRGEQRSLEIRESMLSSLYDLSADLSHSGNLPGIVGAAIQYVERYFRTGAAILILKDGELDWASPDTGRFYLDEKEKAVASWVYRNARIAGRFTDTLPESLGLYIPLYTPGGVFGVLGLALKEPLDLSGENQLQSMAGQIALAIEREFLAEKDRNTKVAQESERLFGIVMNTISHELKSPLTAILGGTTTLLGKTISLEESAREALLREMYSSTIRLQRLVDNMLDLSRLDAGRLELKKKEYHLSEALASALLMLRKELEAHTVHLDCPEEIRVFADFSLLRQAVVLILHNAAMYTPAGTEVNISAELSGSDTVLRICDTGPGTEEKDLEMLFEKFYRGQQRKPGGAGLGLALARGIAELHNGSLTAQRNLPSGLCFTIRLPSQGSSSSSS